MESSKITPSEHTAQTYEILFASLKKINSVLLNVLMELSSFQDDMSVRIFNTTEKMINLPAFNECLKEYIQAVENMNIDSTDLQAIVGKLDIFNHDEYDAKSLKEFIQDFQENIIDVVWSFHYHNVRYPQNLEQRGAYVKLANKMVSELTIEECSKLLSLPLPLLNNHASKMYSDIHGILTSEKKQDEEISFSDLLLQALERKKLPLMDLPADALNLIAGNLEISTRKKILQISPTVNTLFKSTENYKVAELLDIVYAADYEKAENITDLDNLFKQGKHVHMYYNGQSIVEKTQIISPIQLARKLFDPFMIDIFWKKICIERPKCMQQFIEYESWQKSAHDDLFMPFFYVSQLYESQSNAYAKDQKRRSDLGDYYETHTMFEANFNADLAFDMQFLEDAFKKFCDAQRCMPWHIIKEFCRVSNFWNQTKETFNFTMAELKSSPSICKIYSYATNSWEILTPDTLFKFDGLAFQRGFGSWGVAAVDMFCPGLKYDCDVFQRLFETKENEVLEQIKQHEAMYLEWKEQQNNDETCSLGMNKGV